MKRISNVTGISTIMIFWIVNLFVMESRLSAKQEEHGIRIHIIDSSGSAQLNEAYLNGYRKTVDGQTLEYHSSHPDAASALLVRAQKETHSISWETDTLVAPPSGEFYKFVWLAGIEKSGWGGSTPAHTFILSINGERWFTFKNYKDSTAQQWIVKRKDGSELSFKSRMADKFGDLFGYMFLNLPKKDFQPGSPVTIRVDGEDAGSMDWYMVFQYQFNLEPKVRVEPVLLKGTAGETQMLRLSLDNLKSGRAIEMETPAGEQIRKPLNVGANIFMLPIPVVSSERQMPLEFSVNEEPSSHFTVNVRPVKQREVYLLCYSHNDIGYTDLQQNVKLKQINNIKDGFALTERTEYYPQGSIFKWNLEVLWPLPNSYMINFAGKGIKVPFAIEHRYLGLNGLLVNPLTGLANAVEMSHFLDYARAVNIQYPSLRGIKCAVVSDIPGFSWGLVTALAQSGVKYFSSAPNNGDRVGYIYDWGDKPFYWKSQSGEERILFWMAGASYSSFHEGTLARLGDEKILKLMRKLDETGYPYDMYQLPYTTGDNGAPDSTLSDFVKAWNERYASPRLIIATHEEMFEEFERRYGSSLPEYSGDLTPYWEDGAMSTAFETIESRRAVDRLIQGEAIWSMRRPEEYPGADYNAAWYNVTMWDEHTWGASNSVTEPDSPGVIGQWKIKKLFASSADSKSRVLLEKGLSSPTTPQRLSGPKALPNRSLWMAAHKTLPPPVLPQKSSNAFMIYNTNSWVRTDIVYLTPEQSKAGDLVIDARGKKVPSQRLSTGELAVLVKEIQPMSAKRFSMRKGKAFNPGHVTLNGLSMGNDFFSVSLDPRAGTIASLHVKDNNIEFVDTNKNSGLNRYIYIPGTNADSAMYLTNVKIQVKERGNLVSSFVIEGDAPGCKSYKSEIRVFDGIDRIDIIDEIDKLAIRTKEAVHVAFPFSVPGAEVRYDVANGIVRPEKDQLSGACKNFFSVQSWVDASNDTFGVTLALPDVPLIEIGSITAEQLWMKTIAPSSTIYSYAMNNYWHTNYKADQEGPVTFRYSVMPHGKHNSVQASRFGMEQRQPLIAASADRKDRAAPSLFSIDASGVIALSVKPVDEGKSWMLYLYNPSEQSQSFKIQWDKAIPVRFTTSTPDGRFGNADPGVLTIPQFGSEYIGVERIKQ